jgi:hypothetical protein
MCVEMVSAASGASDQGVWRPRPPPAARATLFSHGRGPIGPQLRHHIILYTLTFTFGGKEGD